jgi:tricorn protease
MNARVLRSAFAPLALTLLAGTTLARGPEPVQGYYRFPTVHGDTIVFSSENDLWKVNVAGGQATRLTTYQSNAAYARFSPDGKWLAFTSGYEGNNDVSVMPAEGGVAQRLTFHPANDQVVAWTPDSQQIVFRTARATPHRDQFLYTVPVSGGPATQINIGIGALAAISPDGKTIAYNRWSTEFRTWKRYRGGTAPDLWIGQPDKPETIRRLTQWEGTDDFPMFAGSRLCFLSDRDGRSNIWSCNPDGSDLKQHTFHKDFDARWPDNDDSAGDKARIVYMLGADIWCLDLATGKDAKVEITLPSDRYFLRTKTESVGDHIDRYEVSNDGTRVATDGRGQIFISPTKPGRTVEIPRRAGVRERSAALSPDGRLVAFITDESGAQEIALADVPAPGSTAPSPAKAADAGAKPPIGPVGGRKLLTSDGKGWIFGPVWSPDGRTIAYADMTFQLHLVDVASGQNKVIDRAKGWEIVEYAFSPDSKWIAYTAPNVLGDGRSAGRSEIKLYNLEQGKSWSISTPFASDSSPAWDPKGRYLYFLSNRTFDPTLDQNELNFIVKDTTKPYALILRDGDLSPFAPRELLAARDKREKDAAVHDKQDADKKDADKKDAKRADAKSESDKDGAPDAEPVEVKIDTADLAARVVEFPVEAGTYRALSAVDGKVLYIVAPVEGLLASDELGGDDKTPKFALHAFSFESRKDEPFIESLRDYTLSPDGSKIAWRVKDKILVAGTEGKPEAGEEKGGGDKLAVDTDSLAVTFAPLDEWKQIFWEAWRLERDFYWTPDMAKLDWQAIGDSYGALLPRIGSRQELNDLVGQLIGELGTSHTYVWGGDITPGRKPVPAGTLGARLDPDKASGAWRITRVLRPEVFENDIAAPLTLSHVNARDGDYLWAIDGIPASATQDISALLAGKGGKQIVLSIGSKADRSDAREVQIEALHAEEESELAYADWCRTRRLYVEEKTAGRVGYFHMPDMGAPGLIKFVKGFYPQIGKQALIIDDRYNGGGFVSQMVIARLRATPIAYGTSRYGPWEAYPNAATRGPKCVLINFNAGSDGDIFPDSFRACGLGPVIGTRTWGGVVGIRADKKFIDGGLSTQPEFSWLDPKRGWSIENHGVDPDIEIDNSPADQAAGRDAQLDRAIEEMEKALKANPVPDLVQPPIPDKRPHGGGEWLKKP